MKISLIAAIDEQNGLGKDNHLLCHLPRDLQHFKALTLGKPVIMGRKTWESIGKPLPNRDNVIISQTLSAVEGARVYPSLELALGDFSLAEEVMIIGGESLYKLVFPLATDLYLTRIHQCFPADVFFPIDAATSWHLMSETFYEKDDKNHYDMTFLHYVNPAKTTH
jgi:dihydrofolate reductase